MLLKLSSHFPHIDTCKYPRFALPREQFFFFSSLVPNPDNVMATKKAKTNRAKTKRAKTKTTRAKDAMEVEETAGK